MTKSKIITGAVAALTLTAAVIGSSAPAFAWHHHHGHHGFGPGLGFGLAIGTIAAAAAASNAYEPVYECRYVKRYNRWGERRIVKICDVERY